MPTQDATARPGWPTWRYWLTAATLLTLLAAVIVHTIHATSPFGAAAAPVLLGATRALFAIAACAWPVCEINHWNNRRSTAAVHAEIRTLHTAVEQLRRELSAALAAAVEQTGARVDALAERVAEHGDRRYLEGSQQVMDSLSPGGDVLPMPRRHTVSRNGGPAV